MPDHEIRGVQVDINRGLREKESAHAAADKHGNETESEEGCRGDLYVRAVQAPQPDERNDRGGNSDGQSRERKKQ